MRYRKLLTMIPLIVSVSCGVKGNPKLPKSDRPNPVTELNIKQTGNFAVVTFRYKPNLESPRFEVYRDNKIYPVDVRNTEDLYWFFDNLDTKEVCYYIVVKKDKKSSKPSEKKCLTPVGIERSNLPDLQLKNQNDGIFIKLPVNEKINLYKVSSYEHFYPLPALELTSDYTDKDVKEGETYCYYYSLYVSKGVESDYSKTVCIQYRDTFPPNPPTRGKLVVNQDGSVLLIWQESDSDDVVGYIVYKNSEPLIELPIKTYYFTDKDYKDGDTYDIVAVDKANNKSLPLEIR